VALDARKREAEGQYDIVMKLKIESKTKGDAPESIFLLELEYGGIFKVENVPEQQLHPYLLIEYPRMLFPFVRRIVADVTRDGGFPPLNLDQIDFVALYRQQLAQRAAQQQPTTNA
jgi:preprotein translocase subunit SecB